MRRTGRRTSIRLNETPGADPSGGISEKGVKNMVTKRASKPKVKQAARRRTSQTVGESIIEGLQQAIAWTRGENDHVRVTLVHVPEVDVREVRTKMGLSQAQFMPPSSGSRRPR